MISGIILASGFSKRMGTDKLLLKVDGVPMIERVIREAKASKLDEIILVYRNPKVMEIGLKYDIKTVYNGKAEFGQSEALKLGVLSADESAEAYMFFVGDQPFIYTSLIDHIIDKYEASEYLIAVPYYNGRKGNPSIFSSLLKNELLNVVGDMGGREIIDKNQQMVRKVFIDDIKAGMDIDNQWYN
jgi:molybdenum cofactor cytidylyltransferase